MVFEITWDYAHGNSKVYTNLKFKKFKHFKFKMLVLILNLSILNLSIIKCKHGFFDGGTSFLC